MKKQVETVYKNKLATMDLPQGDPFVFINVCCPQCSQPSKADDININDKIAKCAQCDVVFTFAQEALQLNSLTEAISRPSGIEVYEETNFSEISMQQPHPLLHLIIASVLPLVILIFSLAYFKKGVDWTLYPMIGSLALFLFSIFQLASRKEDKIFLTIERNKLLVEYRPQNLIRDKSIQIHHIVQLYVKYSETGVALMVITDDGSGQKHQVLLSRIESIIKAKYLEQELERILGIANKKVIGEQKIAE